jgi:hypothetical protein
MWKIVLSPEKTPIFGGFLKTKRIIFDILKLVFF